MQVAIWNQLQENEKVSILSRPIACSQDDIKQKVSHIIERVKMHGDQELLKLTREIDGASLEAVAVTPQEFADAKRKVSGKVIESLNFARSQISIYHQAQIPENLVVETYPGIVCERHARAIQRVGLYVPGGTAPLVSTLLMLAVPAKIAGCPIRILCTPPNINGVVNPAILVAAELCGIQQVYKLGGAQAIAAMAYGTESVPKVDKIFGPGNTWVTAAKQLVSQDFRGASIDLPAGPSELMVIADKNAVSDYVAADLLSQAEHDINSQVMLLTTCQHLQKKIAISLAELSLKLPRKAITQKSLANSWAIVVDTIEQAIGISNEYAPEHLLLHLSNPRQLMPAIQNAGAVFLGAWTPETLGDYITGSNHVLPTYGYARSYSGLSLTDFMKFISFQTVTQQGLRAVGKMAKQLADLEGLDAHAQAVTLRLKKEIIVNECN
ncbi:MAG: histidinol dehydrogenase [Gammaproteobacteria bacterium]